MLTEVSRFSVRSPTRSPLALAESVAVVEPGYRSVALVPLQLSDVVQSPVPDFGTHV